MTVTSFYISKNHAWVRIPPVLSDGNSAGRAEKIYGPVVALSLYVIIFFRLLHPAVKITVTSFYGLINCIEAVRLRL